MKKRSILVQFLRHSGFWLTTSDDVNVVIDPVLSSRYRNEELVHPPFEPRAIEKADAVLITHLHPDHFDRYPPLNQCPKSRLKSRSLPSNSLIGTKYAVPELFSTTNLMFSL